MSFSVALRMLKDGYKVQRKDWGNQYLKLSEDKKHFVSFNSYIEITFDDFLAEDWREYKESNEINM